MGPETLPERGWHIWVALGGQRPYSIQPADTGDGTVTWRWSVFSLVTSELLFYQEHLKTLQFVPDRPVADQLWLPAVS